MAPDDPEQVAADLAAADLAKEFAEGLPKDYSASAAASQAAPGEQAKPKLEVKKEEVPEDKAAGDAEGAKVEADPLAILDIDTVIKHPVHGPALQSRIDTAAAARARVIVDDLRPKIEEDIRQQLVSQNIRQHFESLSKDELAQELADDPQAAVAYAQVMEEKLREPKDAVEDAVTRVRADQITSNLAILQESGLPDLAKTNPEVAKVMTSLDPNKYVHLGPPGIVEWGKAIQKAIIDHRVRKDYEAKLEADRQVSLADQDPDRPPDLSPGRGVAPTPDLMKTDTTVGLEHAFSQKQDNKK